MARSERLQAYIHPLPRHIPQQSGLQIKSVGTDLGHEPAVVVEDHVDVANVAGLEVVLDGLGDARFETGLDEEVLDEIVVLRAVGLGIVALEDDGVGR